MPDELETVAAFHDLTQAQAARAVLEGEGVSSQLLEELQACESLLRLDHTNIAHQIRPFLFRPTPVSAAYWTSNALAAAFVMCRPISFRHLWRVA
jgi:hypothetical protein